MTSTFGAPGTARSGRGHAGLDASTVRPITPGNPVPGLYSVSAIRPHPIRIGPGRSTSLLSGDVASPLRDDHVAAWSATKRRGRALTAASRLSAPAAVRRALRREAGGRVTIDGACRGQGAAGSP